MPSYFWLQHLKQTTVSVWLCCKSLVLVKYVFIYFKRKHGSWSCQDYRSYASFFSVCWKFSTNAQDRQKPESLWFDLLWGLSQKSQSSPSDLTFEWRACLRLLITLVGVLWHPLFLFLWYAEELQGQVQRAFVQNMWTCSANPLKENEAHSFSLWLPKHFNNWTVEIYFVNSLF